MADEERRAQDASNDGGDTIFGKILRGEIPANFIHEDEQCVAFHDVHPQAPTHIVLIPRKAIPQLSKSEEEDKAVLGHLLYTAQQIAKQEKLDDGFRIVINDGKNGCQSVYHLHIHIIGGRKLGWPPG